MSDSVIRTLLIFVPLLPLLAVVVVAIFGPRILKSRSHWPVIAALLGSFLVSLALLFAVWGAARQATLSSVGTNVGWATTLDLWTWVDVQSAYAMPGDSGLPPAERNLNIGITLRVDSLTAIMFATVTFVALLVAFYSSGYMKSDRSYARYFTYLSLFVFSMLMLVSVSNFVLLYVFWEGVGVCSYLLIGFWYEKPAAAAAGKKAFLVNRVGDFGLALAIFLIWTTYGTLNFHDTTAVPGVLGEQMLTHPERYVGGAVGLSICLLLLLGACGKSAQFPLHVWLPDAMEGPTPVSALIHAATMVTAGVYLVTRCTPLFMASSQAQLVVACIGGWTALMAGIIALTQTDLKRVLAYSTISQLGYMFLGLGTGTLLGITAGMFHLFTHAWFKALLFLGAGSVMHATGGVIDMRRFGGLRRALPVTHWTFLFGCMALSGFIPFAGFWSKDSILAALHEMTHHNEYGTVYAWLYYGGTLTAMLTAIYTFRAYFLSFHGEEKIPAEAGRHAQESPRSMTLPLVLLAVGALVGGCGVVTFASFLGSTPSLAYAPLLATGPSHALHISVAIISTTMAFLGVGIAAYFYLGHPAHMERFSRRIWPLYQLSYGKFFCDQIYAILVVWPCMALASLSAWSDRFLIDGLVNACGRVPLAVGALLREMHTGMLQLYALLTVLGLLMLLGALLI